MKLTRFIGRARIGPVAQNVDKSIESTLQSHFYTREEFNKSLMSTATKLDWVDGLEIQFTDGREYGIELPGPQLPEIKEVCQGIKDQGYKMSLHLSKHFIDLFRSNSKTGDVPNNPNEFFNEFDFNPIVGHFNEDIYHLNSTTDNYTISGTQLDDKFSKRIVLEPGFRINNKLSELVRELNRRTGRKIPHKSYVCLELGHFGRALKENADDVSIRGQDHERRYAISAKWRLRIEQDLAAQAEILEELRGKINSIEYSDKDLERSLEAATQQFDRLGKIIVYYSEKDLADRQVFYFNTSRIRECGQNARHMHAHQPVYRRDENRWLDHFPFGFYNRVPTPLQHKILTKMINEAVKARNLESYATEHRKEYNTPYWLNQTHKYVENKLLPN